MSGDNEDRSFRRPRVLARPRVQPGPLRDLKDLLYELYLQAGAPPLDDIAALIRDDDELPGAPQRDTIRRCISSPTLPPNQHDAVAVATVLARSARWNEHDAVSRARELWVQGRMIAPRGRPINELTDPFELEVHRAIEAPGHNSSLPLLPPYVPRAHDVRLRDVVGVAAAGASRMVALVGGSSTGKTRACWEAIQA